MFARSAPTAIASFLSLQDDVNYSTRLSERAYLTFARALGATTHGDQIIILEYDQSDRLGLVLTQNGSNTFAIDLRFRRTF